MFKNYCKNYWGVLIINTHAQFPPSSGMHANAAAPRNLTTEKCAAEWTWQRGTVPASRVRVRAFHYMRVANAWRTHEADWTVYFPVIASLWHFIFRLGVGMSKRFWDEIREFHVLEIHPFYHKYDVSTSQIMYYYMVMVCLLLRARFLSCARVWVIYRTNAVTVIVRK